MNYKEKNFSDLCKEYIQNKWKEITVSIETGVFSEPLLPGFEEIKRCIVLSLKSAIKSYHYVLPTQILCKCVDPRLDCHSLQSAYSKPGAFDARSIAHQVIVPFDQENNRVLGGSVEPYVNNPLRCPAVIPKYRDQQRNKAEWDNLINVLDIVEKTNSPIFTERVFLQILFEIYKLLSDVHVVYPTPNRISLKQTIDLILSFTANKSGGDRIEAVTAALFRAVSIEFRLFDEIKRQKVNVSDASSGMTADIECWCNGKITLLVEVKDRSLTMTQLDSKLDSARAKKISEILFLAEQGIDPYEIAQTEIRIKNEFSSGQNIYVASFIEFSTGILILLGEKGRIRFLTYIGEELDKANSSISHRRSWAQLLKTL